MAETKADVIAATTFVPGEASGFYRFLQKFQLLDHIPWDTSLIDRSIAAVAQSLEEENVDYCWLRFSVNKYRQYMGCSDAELILFIAELFAKYRPNKVGLILSLKYESEHAYQKQLAKLVLNPSIAAVLSGIDLVGDENQLDVDFYRGLLSDWHSCQKRVFAHVGESQSADNIYSAIRTLGVTDICHGIKLFDSPEAVSLAQDTDVCFHMALSSNYLTGVCVRHAHPIVKFLLAGLKVTIGTDDPTQCDTSMATEYRMLRSELHYAGYDIGETDDVVRRIKATARDRVFGDYPNILGR